MHGPRLPARAVIWAKVWAPILPLLFAEFILWTGFGALLPVMPLYFTEHGVPIALLGVVIAAWPAARLVAEPLFGVLADRTARVPVMVGGLLLAAVAVGAMAIWTAPVAFIALRALSGLGTAMYDPAARGYLTDAAPPERQGEVFGLYNSAQNGGILLGPAIGGLGTALVGGYAFVLVFGSVMTTLAAIAIVLRVREQTGPRGRRLPAGGLSEFPSGPSPELPFEAAASSVAVLGSDHAKLAAAAPRSLRNRFILAAVLVNLAGYFGGGLYETIWALFVTDRGGGVELVGVTFATFGLITMLFSPMGGRIVDRRGPYPFIVGGLLVMVVTMFLYPFVPLTILYIPLVAIEALGFSFLGPATYAVIGRGTPDGRSSTAQGLLGAAGTIGTIVASLISGVLAAVNLSAPFFFGATVVLVLLGLTLLTSGDPLRSMRPGDPSRL